MNLYSFTIFMTDDCNFDCTYCYQKRGKTYLDISSLERAVDFFYPYLTEKCYINFYGGEPMLAFSRIKHAVNYIKARNKAKENKRIIFSMTTNGSLLNAGVMEFLNQHKFLLLLSYDGLSQDISRSKGSFEYLVETLQKLLDYPDIDLETNSVFTPETIGFLSKSVQFIAELGVPNICVVPCQVSSWDHSALFQLKEELGSLKRIMLDFRKKNGSIPLVNFRKNRKRGIFSCHAAKDRLAMSSLGKLWGCHLFADFYNGKEDTKEYSKYCFGGLNAFVESFDNIYPEILANYSNLRMDTFRTEDALCAECDELKDCRLCPIDNRAFNQNLTEIPLWNCEKNKIFREVRRDFWRELGTNKSY